MTSSNDVSGLEQTLQDFKQRASRVGVLQGDNTEAQVCEHKAFLAVETWLHHRTAVLSVAGASCQDATDFGRFGTDERRLDCSYQLPCVESKSSHSPRPQTVSCRVLQVNQILTVAPLCRNECSLPQRRPGQNKAYAGGRAWEASDRPCLEVSTQLVSMLGTMLIQRTNNAPLVSLQAV